MEGVVLVVACVRAASCACRAITLEIESMLALVGIDNACVGYSCITVRVSGVCGACLGTHAHLWKQWSTGFVSYWPEEWHGLGIGP